jgi:PIN domain nuclease of toxin-antitoxin system
MPTAERILLDTHVLLWWKADRRRLSPTARRHIEAADLLISPMTFWEVAMLVEKQRIALDRPTTAWTNDVLADPRASLPPLTPGVAVAAAEFSPFPGDPVDRILTARPGERGPDATAVEHGLPILSKDTGIRTHARGRSLRVLW